jgi:hypothetical protein
MASLPIDDDDRLSPIRVSASQNDTSPLKSKSVGMLRITSDEIRNRFEQNKNRYIEDLRPLLDQLSQDDEDEVTEDKIAKGKIEEDPELKIYYFIGRLNPPHNGHIEGLRQLIQAAGDNGKVLILLGSGPNGGDKTLNDPIDFILKRDFIVKKLSELLGDDFIHTKIDDGDIQILEMGTAAAQIASESKRMINPEHKTVTITRFSGDKDGDLEKLKYVDNSAVQRIQGEHENMEVSARAIPVSAISASGIEMSATAVRKDAYRAYLEDKNSTKPERERAYENFRSKYDEFYGDDIYRVYQAIIGPIISKHLTDDQVQVYIDTSRILNANNATKALGKEIVKASTKKGGTLTKRTKKNKKLRITRRKSKRNKKKSRRYKYKD